MNDAVIKKPIYKKWWFWVIVVIVIAAIGKSGDKDDKSSSSSNSASSATSNLPPMPPQEESFIKAIGQAQNDSKNAENDMQKGGILATRNTSVCGLMTNKSVNNWVGKVQKIDANSDGKGVIGIEIARNIVLKTWNNDLSDIGDNTLLSPSSPLFQTASMLKKGQSVNFSGTFLPGRDGECIREGSLSLSGKLRDPEFIFRFTSISAN